MDENEKFQSGLTGRRDRWNILSQRKNLLGLDYRTWLLSSPAWRSWNDHEMFLNGQPQLFPCVTTPPPSSPQNSTNSTWSLTPEVRWLNSVIIFWWGCDENSQNVLKLYFVSHFPFTGIFYKDNAGTVNIQGFQQLWAYIEQWKETFDRYGLGRSGAIELHRASAEIGFNVSPRLSIWPHPSEDHTSHVQKHVVLFTLLYGRNSAP